MYVGYNPSFRSPQFALVHTGAAVLIFVLVLMSQREKMILRIMLGATTSIIAGLLFGDWLLDLYVF